MSNSPTPPPPREGQRHTQEPWGWQHVNWRGEHAGDRLFVYGDARLDDDGNPVSVGVAIVEGNSTSHTTTEANAARIVACVNACAGFSSPATDVPRLIEAARKLADQADYVDMHVLNRSTHGVSLLREVQALRAALPPEVRP